jgi:C-lobe and N-lobe beta barrels of Tf-binding protein B
MRIAILLIGTSLLSACGGGGTQSAGNTPAPIAPGSTPGTGTAANHTFTNPTVDKTYKAIGAGHSYQYAIKVNDITGTSSGQDQQLYRGNATTLRDSAISVAYSPRDAIFDISYVDSRAGLSSSDRFQDPAHRTDFGGAVEPQQGTPQLASPGIQYLQHSNPTTAASIGLVPGYLLSGLGPQQTMGSYDQTTFFYQKPGTSTKYVTFAGFLRNSITLERLATAAVPASPGVAAVAATSVTTHTYNLSRGLFVFGENTVSNVPKSGTGNYSGTMLASMVFNDQIDSNGNAPTYFQMIEGTAASRFDFGANTFSLDLTGTTYAPQSDLIGGNTATIQANAAFRALGGGRIDLVTTGGFTGQFQQAWFVNPGGTRLDLNIAGSSIDGGFYGPTANEVGSSFRIVGGTPDERIDILGVFVGK